MSARESGNGIHKGYAYFMLNGERTYVHIFVAEKALGRPLPPKAVVHHHDENQLNNEPTNLVICPNNSYHLVLHRRMRAYDECGHASWRKCGYCLQWDDPANMSLHPYNAEHKRCKKEYDRIRNSKGASL